jgi:hypothetical protein
MYLTEEWMERGTQHRPRQIVNPQEVRRRILHTTAHSWWEGGVPPVRAKRRDVVKARIAQFTERAYALPQLSLGRMQTVCY